MRVILRVGLAVLLASATPVYAATVEERLAAQERELAELRALVLAQSELIAALQMEVRAEGPDAVDAALPPAAAREPVGPVTSGAPNVVPEKPAVRSTFDVELYGYVKLDVIHDSARMFTGNIGYWALPKGFRQDDGETNITANQTRLGLDVHGPRARGGDLSAKVEIDFYGANSPDDAAKLRMRKAYVLWDHESWSLLAGQDTDTFVSLLPQSIDFNYFNYRGNLGFRRAQLRVTRTLEVTESSDLVFKAAIARTIGQDLDGLGQNDGADADWPTFQWNAQWKGRLPATSSALFSVSGHYGEEHLDPCPGIEEKTYETWSVIGSAQLQFTQSLSLRAQVWSGANLDTYRGGLAHGINTSLNTAVAAQGGFIQLIWNPSTAWSLAFAYGLDDPDDADLEQLARSENTHFTTSLSYTIAPGWTVALEHAYLQTTYKDASDAENNRFQGAAIFSF